MRIQSGAATRGDGGGSGKQGLIYSEVGPGDRKHGMPYGATWERQQHGQEAGAREAFSPWPLLGFPRERQGGTG